MGIKKLMIIVSGLVLGCSSVLAREQPTAVGFVVSAQTQPSSPRSLTMKETILLAQEQSISSMVNRNIFAAAYWNHRSYKADRLPSLNLSAGLVNVERSIMPLQDATTGAVNYRGVFTLRNDVSMFIRQKISATGGTLSLASSVQRFDQFNPDNLTWYSQPITLSYMQPLFGYNAYKWSKRIEPHNFERAKLEYLENMENVSITAVGYFWGVAMARLNRDIAAGNYENSKRLYRIAEERYKIGSIGRDEVLQMELRVLNDSLAINSSQITYTSQRNRLASFIGLREDVDVELDIDYELPGIELDYDRVLATALENSSFELNQRIELLEAERAIAQARANRGIDVSFNARFGLSQSGESFSRAYSHLRSQQVAGFSVGIPILDWGVGRGRVKMAESTAATIRYRQEQARIDFEQDILVRVMEFNARGMQCEVSRRAAGIADERFSLSVENFTRGTLSVTELNTAQTDRDNAHREYLANMGEYWTAYFALRRLSLFDWLSGTDIGAAFGKTEYDKLIE
ncbi:MAG: TolC family protein [Alistipes sp.]|jgi:outer membrane protein TolC|nr:TolC family protein [Alistipes sp.]